MPVCLECGKSCKSNAGLVSHRRTHVVSVPPSRAEDLRADYVALGLLLSGASGSGAAAIVRERRIIGVELERLETPEEVSYVDELAARRKDAGARRPSSRRKSG